MSRYTLTVDEAINLLPDGEEIHTFISAGSALMGADHSRKSLIERMGIAERVELAGEQAKSMKHGIVIFPKGAKYQSDLYFVETDEDKLSAFEAALEAAGKE